MDRLIGVFENGKNGKNEKNKNSHEELMYVREQR